MKTSLALPIWIRSGLLTAVLALATPQLHAADTFPPERLTYQGFLVDGNGVALGNTNTGPKNYDVIFRVYLSQSGGASRWTEQQTLTVDKGYFSVLLGEGSAVGSDPHNDLSTVFSGTDASDRFIGITVKGIGEPKADVDILPRLRMLTSPYSFLSRNSVNAANLVNAANGQIVTLSGTNVGINKTGPGTALDVNGIVTATAFSGNGANINTLNAANITSGTVNDARLSVNVATLPGAQTFSGTKTFNGGVNISGTGVLEFGYGLSGRAGDAGKVGYQIFSTDALDIVGAAQDGLSRKIKLWGEGGVYLAGPLVAPSAVVSGNVNANSLNVGSLNGDVYMPSGHLSVNQGPIGGVVANFKARAGEGYLLWLYNQNGGLDYTFGEGGDARKAGAASWTSTSDERVKKNITTLTGALDKLMQLRSVNFEYIKDPTGKNERYIGFIAQEVEKVFPTWVSDGPDGMKGLTLKGIESLTVQALRELRAEKEAQINSLKEENAALRAALDSQEKRLQALEKAVSAPR